MDPALTQPYEHLVQMLSTFAADARLSQPPGSPRWSRTAIHLDRELHRLQSLAPLSQKAPASIAAGNESPNHSALKETAIRLTQLARTLDGLRFERSAVTPAAQLADEQRLVVFGAWQLLQALEHSATLQPAAGFK